MQPNTDTLNYRHFFPGEIVRVLNPFDEDIEFFVADELDRKIPYIMPANQESELPGGPIATLGVKEIVDRKMHEENMATQMWVLTERAKVEDRIITFYKPSPQSQLVQEDQGGSVNLSTGSAPVEDPAFAEEVEIEEEAFPELKAKAPTKAKA